MSASNPPTPHKLTPFAFPNTAYDCPKPAMPNKKPSIGISVALSVLVAVAGAAITYGALQSKVHDTESRQLLLETSQNEMRKAQSDMQTTLGRIDERVLSIQEALRRYPR